MNDEHPPAAEHDAPAEAAPVPPQQPDAPSAPREFGGPAGLEPTRYGDWERMGRCYDF